MRIKPSLAVVVLVAAVTCSCAPQRGGAVSSTLRSPLSPLSPLDELEADYDANAQRAVPRDSFDVLDEPELVAAGEATSLEDDEYVLGISLGGESKAYPIGALGESELFNDVCGGIPIAGSW